MQQPTEKALTLKEVAELLNMSYAAVYNHRHQWGAFQMEGSSAWRIYPSDLENARKKKNNVFRLARLTPSTGEKQCQSTNEKTSIGWILPHQVEKELDDLLALKLK
ncbi:helix-turn-helix domain-containing protein [Pasteurellaceae bacterium LIM206]|nr:helix-turn-helix domain-containing protein [Pasteurellaceae bacterium LIM206]